MSIYMDISIMIMNIVPRPSTESRPVIIFSGLPVVRVPICGHIRAWAVSLPAGPTGGSRRAAPKRQKGDREVLVRQAANVLELLEFFAAHKKPASLAQVAQHFGWPRSSTFNLLSTLIERGFLYEPRPRGGYYPTPRWLALAQEIVAAEPLPEALVRLVRDLAERSGETVWISAPSGQHAVLLEVVQSTQAVRYTAEAGKRVPLYATASGQAILSQMTPAQCASLLRKTVFERYSSGTPMSVEAVEESIRRSLERGWFQSASAFSRDLGGASVPIVADGRILSVTVAGPLFRVAGRMEDFGRELHRAVARHLGRDYFARQVPNLARLPV